MMFGPPARISQHYSHGLDFSYLDDSAIDEKALLALEEQRRARRAARAAARQQRHQRSPLRAVLSKIFCGLCNALGDHYDDETLPAARTIREHKDKDAEWASLLSSTPSSPSTSPRASLLPSSKRDQAVRVTVTPIHEEVADGRISSCGYLL